MPTVVEEILQHNLQSPRAQQLLGSRLRLAFSTTSGEGPRTGHRILLYMCSVPPSQGQVYVIPGFTWPRAPSEPLQVATNMRTLVGGVTDGFEHTTSLD